MHANWLAGSVAHAMRSRRLDDRRQDARPSRIFWAVSAILQALDNRSKRLMMTTREATRSVIHSKAGSSLTAVTLLLRDAVASTRFWTIKDLPGNCISVPCLPNAPPPTHQQVAIWWRVPEDAFKSIVNGMTITVVFDLRGGMPGTKGSGRHKGGTSEGSGRHKGGTSAGSVESQRVCGRTLRSLMALCCTWVQRTARASIQTQKIYRALRFSKCWLKYELITAGS